MTKHWQISKVLLVIATIDSSSLAERLGRQAGQQKTVDSVDGFANPGDFLTNYVIPGKPVLFRGAAKSFPAFSKWTDEYLELHPDSKTHIVDVEEGKKENRNDGERKMKLSEFVQIYKNDDIYCVSRLPPFMAADIPIHTPVNCPYILDNLMEDLVMWFSSGGTKSVWHHDGYENINCLFRGRKEIILADRTETPGKVHIDIQDGAYSSVDVDNVDVNKYPGFKDTQFFNVTLEAGDCFYIPWLWFHQVTSFGSNLAVNIWWKTYRTPMLCDKLSLKSLDDVQFKFSEDGVDGNIVDTAHQDIYLHNHMYNNTSIGKRSFLEAVGESFDDHDMEYVSDAAILELFNLLDLDSNSLLNYTEIDRIRDVLPKYILLFKDEL